MAIRNWRGLEPGCRVPHARFLSVGLFLTRAPQLKRSGHRSHHCSRHRIFALHDASTPRAAAIDLAAVEMEEVQWRVVPECRMRTPLPQPVLSHFIVRALTALALLFPPRV